MSELVEKALKATKESRAVDFKGEVDVVAAHTWPELVKDIVAMANSGGGVIVIGLDDNGSPTRLLWKMRVSTHS